jgi:hypothetical protein
MHAAAPVTIVSALAAFAISLLIMGRLAQTVRNLGLAHVPLLPSPTARSKQNRGC